MVAPYHFLAGVYPMRPIDQAREDLRVAICSSFVSSVFGIRSSWLKGGGLQGGEVKHLVYSRAAKPPPHIVCI